MSGTEIAFSCRGAAEKWVLLLRSNTPAVWPDPFSVSRETGSQRASQAAGLRYSVYTLMKQHRVDLKTYLHPLLRNLERFEHARYPCIGASTSKQALMGRLRSLIMIAGQGLHDRSVACTTAIGWNQLQKPARYPVPTPAATLGHRGKTAAYRTTWIMGPWQDSVYQCLSAARYVGYPFYLYAVIRIASLQAFSRYIAEGMNGGITVRARPNKAHVVLGFSCAGKSTYIRHLATNTPEFQFAEPVYEHMFHSGLRSELRPGDLFHMDLSAIRAESAAAPNMRVEDHPLWEMVFRQGLSMSVDLLVASRSDLQSRIEARSHIGLGWGMDNALGSYPREAKLKTLNAIDLTLRYDVWRTYLLQREIPHRFLWSTNQRFLPVDGWGHARQILSG